MTLEQIEALHPSMYKIDEKIDLPTPQSYEKLDLPGKTVVDSKNLPSISTDVKNLSSSVITTSSVVDILTHRDLILQRDSLLKNGEDDDDDDLCHDDMFAEREDEKREPGLIQDHLDQTILTHQQFLQATGFLQRQSDASLLQHQHSTIS